MAKKFIGGYISNTINGFSGPITNVEFLVVGGGGGATGGGGDEVFFLNDVVVAHNYDIPDNKNAGTFGPVTIDNGVVVKIPNGSVWTII